MALLKQHAEPAFLSIPQPLSPCPMPDPATVGTAIVQLLETSVLLHTTLRQVFHERNIRDEERRELAEESARKTGTEGLEIVFFGLRRKDLHYLSSSVVVE